MKNPLLLGLLALFLTLPSFASAQGDNAEAAYERKDVAALARMANAGDPVAQYKLGTMYAEGRNLNAEGKGVRQNDAIAVSWSGEAGADTTQPNLEYRFTNGRGLKQDYAAAVAWYSKAADQRYAQAQNILGYTYANGRGVTQDYAAAVSWYRKAADQGNAQAQNNLGYMSREGRGVVQDDAIAVSWYRKAAEQRNAEGRFSLMYMYNVEAAFERKDLAALTRIAEAGDPAAQFKLGFMYASGRGVAKDDAIAVSWYRKAADQGNAQARFNLRRIYKSGRVSAQGDNAEAALSVVR